MARDPVPPAAAGEALYSRPWPLLLAGVVLITPAWVLGELAARPPLLRLALSLAGTALVGLAVLRELRTTSWAWPDRLEAAALVSLAGLAMLGGLRAMDPGWDSARMAYGAAFLLALAGVVLILLPSPARRVALSLWILFHFGGMLTAITSVDPPKAQGPWLSKQLYSRVYRPYLSFLYLTNAYHFYSPDPGPPTLFWFAVRYRDGSSSWVKFPDRANSPIGMHYQRLLALPQHTYSAQPRLPFSSSELAYLPKGTPRPTRGSWEEIYHRREMGTMLLRFPHDSPARRLPIPMVSDLDVTVQYGEPTEPSKKVIAGVARRVFHHLADPPAGARTVSVKLYRVIHEIIPPSDLAKGGSPLEKTRYYPYFLGEFDGDGRLLDDREPFLYWYLPIAYVPETYPHHGVVVRAGVPGIVRSAHPKGGFLLDCLEMHAAGRLPPRDEPEEDR